METILDPAHVVARFDAWADWFGRDELRALVCEVSRILAAVGDARFPAHEPELFSALCQPEWLASVAKSEAYLRRLVTQARGNVGRAPAKLEDIDPLFAAIWNVFDLPKAADEEFVQSLADACRAGEPHVSQCGIRALKLKKRKQGPRHDDMRWRLVAATAHRFIFPDSYWRSRGEYNEHFRRDCVLRAAIRAIVSEMGISISESSVSSFLVAHRKSLTLDAEGSLIGTRELRRASDSDIDPSLFGLDQITDIKAL